MNPDLEEDEEPQKQKSRLMFTITALLYSTKAALHDLHTTPS